MYDYDYGMIKVDKIAESSFLAEKSIVGMRVWVWLCIMWECAKVLSYA